MTSGGGTDSNFLFFSFLCRYVKVSMKIVDSLLQVCGSNVNMFSKQVIKIVLFLTNTKEIELAALATQIVGLENEISLDDRPVYEIQDIIFFYFLSSWFSYVSFYDFVLLRPLCRCRHWTRIIYRVTRI